MSGDTADEPVPRLYAAGGVTGLMRALMRAGYVMWFARRNGIGAGEAFKFDHFLHASVRGIWALGMPFIILGGIFGGFVTATEGAALAVLAALAIAMVIYRDLDLKSLYRAAVDSAIQTAVVMLLVAASPLAGIFLTGSPLPQKLAASIISIPPNPSPVLPPPLAPMDAGVFRLRRSFRHTASVRAPRRTIMFASGDSSMIR